MARIEVDTADLEQWRRQWLRKGEEIAWRKQDAYEAYQGTLCPQHRVPMFREIIQGREVYACPFVDAHRVKPHHIFEQETQRLPAIPRQEPSTEKVRTMPQRQQAKRA